MNPEKMQVGAKYVVTKPSDDTTFSLGDHIHIYDNGDIGCAEARGWIDKQYVKNASKGCEVEIDKEWLEKLESDLKAAKKAAKKAGIKL